MGSTIQQFFVAQALHLRAGRIDLVARAYSLPLVVALPDVEPGYVVLSSRKKVETFFKLKYGGLQEACIDYLRASVVDAWPTTNDRTIALVEWFYLDESGARAGRTRARYFVDRPRGGFCVQMIEFEELAFPAIATWLTQAGATTPRAGGRLH